MSTTLPLGKYLQVDEPEILTQATGIFGSVSQKCETEEKCKIPAHLAKHGSLSASLSLSLSL